MKKIHRVFAMLMAAIMALSLVTTAFAAEPTIDASKKASLSIYKYDITKASEDGVWDAESYVSTGPYLAEQVFFLCLRLGIVDIGDLVFRYAQRQQFIPNVIVDAENTFALGRGQITEDHLCGAFFRRALPDVKYRLRAFGRLALRIAGQHGIDEPLV